MTALPIESLESRRLLAFSPIDIGGKHYDSGYQTAMDAQGNILVAGIFQGKTTFPGAGGSSKTLTSVGQTDIYIAKYSAGGSLLWVGQIGGGAGKIVDKKALQYPIDPSRAGGFLNRVGIEPEGFGEYVNGIAVDPSGNVFLTGAFLGTVDFNPGKGVYNIQTDRTYKLPDAFLMKLDSSGGFQWADAFSGVFNDVANAVAVDPQGNPVVTGYFTRRADFDPSKKTLFLDADGRDDVFIGKYNGANGKLIWVDRLGGDATDISSRDAGNDIAIDANGNIFVTGTIAGNKIDFDLGPAVHIVNGFKKSDTFLLELSPKGKYVLGELYGGKGFDGGSKIALHNGNIYIASYFQGDIDADPGTGILPFTAAGNSRFTDVLISSFNSKGGLNWADQIAGQGYETIGGFGVASDGTVYTSGGFYDQVDFDPGPGNYFLTSTEGDDKFDDSNDSGRKFSYDIYVQRLSSSGTLLAAKRIGSTSDDFGTGLVISPDAGFITLTGQFRGTVNFAAEVKLKSKGAEDGFLIELSAGVEIANVVADLCKMTGEAFMNIALSQRTQELLEEKMKAGGFASSDEVVHSALQALDSLRGPDVEDLPEEVQQSIQRAFEQWDRGEGRPWEEVRAKLQERYFPSK